MEGQENYLEISRVDRFRYRTRYFTDSGIIGSKEFVAEHFILPAVLYEHSSEKGFDLIHRLPASEKREKLRRRI